MAKPKIPNQKTKYNQLNKRLSDYVALVRKIYDVLNLEAAKMAERVHYNGDKPFRFRDYPQLKDSVLKLKNKFSTDMQALIYSGTSREWKESNLVQDLIADKVLKAYGATVRGEKYKVYYQPNSDALKAFQTRKDNGLTLSQKLWNQATNYREELEYAISSAIQKGTSAVTLSKRISKYLQDFDLLEKDYKQKYGKAVNCHDCEYRSIRLARSEINMAYRTAEQTRWQQMDFVVGYEIKLSHAHHHRMPHGDICDELAGKYPKDFKWTGWHPNDMCYVIPILKTEEEFWADEDVTSKNVVNDVPEPYKLWVVNNQDRILKSRSKPYFLRDNPEWKSYLDIEYHRLEDGKFDKAFKDAQKYLLRQKYENMIILNKKGKEILSIRGNSGDVNFSDDHAKLAKDNIVVHNHPLGAMFNDFRRVGHSFSSSDIKELIKCDMYSIVAISPTYRYEATRPVNGWNASVDEIIKDYRETFNNIKDKYKDQLNNVRDFIVQHLVMKELSRKYGFNYTKIKIK